MKELQPLDLLQPIAFQPSLVDICENSITAGLMLSQILYWTPRTGPESDGWFYKTQAQWHYELRLTRSQQEAARKILRTKGFIEEEIRKQGGGTKIYFRVNKSAINVSLATCMFSASNFPASRLAGNPQTPLQETCKSYKETESTTENTKPFALSAETDKSIHSQVADKIKARYQQQNGVLPPWDARTAGTLKRLLESASHWKVETWLICVDNFYASAKHTGKAPIYMIPMLTDYVDGPKDEFGKTIGKSNGHSNAQASTQGKQINPARIREEQLRGHYSTDHV